MEKKETNWKEQFEENSYYSDLYAMGDRSDVTKAGAVGESVSDIFLFIRKVYRALSKETLPEAHRRYYIKNPKLTAFFLGNYDSYISLIPRMLMLAYMVMHVYLLSLTAGVLGFLYALKDCGIILLICIVSMLIAESRKKEHEKSGKTEPLAPKKLL